MLTSFVYVGREALEMMFLTLMVAGAITTTWRVYSAAALGLLAGVVVGWYAGEALDPYEVLMYGLLSALMFWLFFTSKGMASHIKSHVDAIAENSKGVFMGLFAVWFIYARESMEIFVFMFQSVNNTPTSWLSAALAAALVFGCFPIIKKQVKPATLFTVTRYAFLVFGVWFGYEAIDHGYQMPAILEAITSLL